MFLLFLCHVPYLFAKGFYRQQHWVIDLSYGTDDGIRMQTFAAVYISRLACFEGLLCNLWLALFLLRYGNLSGSMPGLQNTPPIQLKLNSATQNRLIRNVVCLILGPETWSMSSRSSGGRTGHRISSTTLSWDLSSYRVSLVFHADRLRKAANNPLPGQIPTPSPAEEIDGELEWEVERILTSRLNRGKLDQNLIWTFGLTCSGVRRVADR